MVLNRDELVVLNVNILALLGSETRQILNDERIELTR
jgi:hypothetical protein